MLTRARFPLRLLAAGLVLMLAGAAAFGVWMMRASLPDYRGRVVLPAADGRITITRDQHAIPHIEAASEADAYLAMGYVHAQDRLWQMELARLIGRGRTASVLGAQALPLDRLMRTVALAEVARGVAERLDPRTRRLTQAYVDGINGYLDTRRGPLPPEFVLLRHRPEPWRVEDVTLFAKLMAFRVSDQWREDILRASLASRVSEELFVDLFESLSGRAPTHLEHWRQRAPRAVEVSQRSTAGALGSNAFAVAARSSEQGHALLASDPHLGLNAPGAWYLARLRTRDLDVAGGTLPGLPFIVIGRNRTLAWGITTAHADSQDLFVERVAQTSTFSERSLDGEELPADPLAVISTRSETIEVRGDEPVRHAVRHTARGPIISDVETSAAALLDDGEVMALAWTGLDVEDTTLSAGFALSRARVASELAAALTQMDAPVQNILFAAADGSIGMQTVGAMPIRSGFDGRMPVPAHATEATWDGRMTIADMPGKSGAALASVFNANNPVDEARDDIADDWPPRYRAERLADLLSSHPIVGLRDLQAMQTDVQSLLAQRLLTTLTAAPPRDARDRAIIERLRAWDGAMDRARPEPLIFSTWRRLALHALLQDELGVELGGYGFNSVDFLERALREEHPVCDNVGTAKTETCETITASSLAAAVDLLARAYGEDWEAWRWSDANVAQHRHVPFDRVAWLADWFSLNEPVSGATDTLNVAHPSMSEGVGAFPVVHAAGLRFLARMDQRGTYRIAQASGQSGHPLSPHYDDLTAAWAEGEYATFALDAQPPGPSFIINPSTRN